MGSIPRKQKRKHNHFLLKSKQNNNKKTRKEEKLNNKPCKWNPKPNNGHFFLAKTSQLPEILFIDFEPKPKRDELLCFGGKRRPIPIRWKTLWLKRETCRDLARKKNKRGRNLIGKDTPFRGELLHGFWEGKKKLIYSRKSLKPTTKCNISPLSTRI